MISCFYWQAQKHPKANKLICEVIDCGEFGQERRIVSGLYPHYQPEDLEGKRVIIFANLKEALLLESPSHGMVLCACSADHSHIEVHGDTVATCRFSSLLPTLLQARAWCWNRSPASTRRRRKSTRERRRTSGVLCSLCGFGRSVSFRNCVWI